MTRYHVEYSGLQYGHGLLTELFKKHHPKEPYFLFFYVYKSFFLFHHFS